MSDNWTCLSKRLLLRRTLFPIRGGEGTLADGDRQQRRIELDKRRVYSRMVGMATVAVSRRRNHLGGFAFIEAKEGPFARKTRFVFYVHLEPHSGTLVVSFLINRTLPLRATNFEHEYGFVRPSACLNKCLVGVRIDKDVVEHVMVAHLHRRVVTHIEPGAQVHPVPIMLWEPELRVAGIFRTRTRRLRVFYDACHGK